MAGMIDDGFHDEGPIGAINVTSLIDVMFCLLIMFMVSAPLMSPKKDVPLTLPKARAQAFAEEDFMLAIISIDAKGRVFMGATPLSPDLAQMTQELANNPKLQADGRAFIQGDENVPFDRIVDVMAALKQAKVSRVGFVTDPAMKKRG